MTAPRLLTPIQITYLSAYILINSTEGATLTCGSQIYTLQTGETYHIFIVSPGTYICSASYNGEGTKTETVTVTTGTEITLKPSGVPSAYQEVEYLRFTGTQYINTGILPSNVESRFKISQQSYQNNSPYVGQVSNGTAYHVTLYSYKYYFCSGNSESNTGSWVSGIREFIYNHIADGGLYIDGNLSALANNPRADNVLYIGYRGGGGCIGDFYYVKLTDRSTGELIFDGIPCYRKSDSVAGMYDTVTSTLFTNAGTGSIVVGADV